MFNFHCTVLLILCDSGCCYELEAHRGYSLHQMIVVLCNGVQSITLEIKHQITSLLVIWKVVRKS